MTCSIQINFIHSAVNGNLFPFCIFSAQNSLTSDGNPQKEPTTEMENPANQDSIELIDAAPNCEIAQITSSIEFDRISLASDHSASSASSWNSGVLDFHTDLGC